jgi:hypothetical protein
MKKVMGVVFCLALVAVFSLEARPVSAQEFLNYGKLKITPSIEVREIYNDNIFLGNGSNNTTELKDADWITHVLPGLRGDYDMGARGKIFAGYQGQWAYYKDYSDNDWTNQKGFAGADYKSPGGLIFKLDDVYLDAEDPAGDLGKYDTNYKLGIVTARWTNDLKGRLGYEFTNRFRVLGHYRYFVQRYDLDADFSQNHDIKEFGIGPEILLMPKTWGFLRLYYGTQDYEDIRPALNVFPSTNADNDWRRVSLGVSWDSGAKFSGEASLGYTWLDYDNVRDSFGNLYEDKNTWTAQTSVTYMASEITSFTLTVLRGVKSSGAGTKEFYDDTTAGLTVNRVLMPKLTLLAGVAYASQDYNSVSAGVKEREDDNYMANLNLVYQVKPWMDAGISYSYNKKDSNIDTNDYKNNQVMARITLSY